MTKRQIEWIVVLVAILIAIVAIIMAIAPDGEVEFPPTKSPTSTRPVGP